jgi:hypothetical protein
METTFLRNVGIYVPACLYGTKTEKEIIIIITITIIILKVVETLNLASDKMSRTKIVLFIFYDILSESDHIALNDTVISE